MWNFFGLIAHYCARLKRVLDEPAGNKTENISYKLIRKFVRFILLSLREKYKESVKKFGYFLGTLIFVALTISFLWPLGYVISLLCVGISSLRGDFSQFDRYYAIFEVSMNFYIVPPMIYLIVVLLFAHMIGVFFS